MKIEPFKMERLQSTWENIVEYNLSESGVHPLPFRELIPSGKLDEILDTDLGYIQTNGPPALREVVCQLYPGTNIDNILVTTGSAEANFLLVWSSVEPSDEIVFMLPNFMQMWGIWRGFGAHVKPFYLREELDWDPDLDELKKIITKNTKWIILTNPNNPTGAVLSTKAREMIISLAEWADAWILVDEVYQGAELDGSLTPSFWGAAERVVVTNGLSKAYGLPGLRMGWMVAPENLIQKIWTYHDYTTISLSAVSSRLAQIALSKEIREKILERTRTILTTNLPLVESWLQKQGGLFHLVSPKAGAIAFVRYQLNMDSIQLATRILQEKSVLIVPGDHFNMEGYLRIGYGAEKEYLHKALDLIEEVLEGIKNEST